MYCSFTTKLPINSESSICFVFNFVEYFGTHEQCRHVDTLNYKLVVTIWNHYLSARYHPTIYQLICFPLPQTWLAWMKNKTNQYLRWSSSHIVYRKRIICEYDLYLSVKRCVSFVWQRGALSLCCVCVCVYTYSVVIILARIHFLIFCYFEFGRMRAPKLIRFLSQLKSIRDDLAHTKHHKTMYSTWSGRKCVLCDVHHDHYVVYYHLFLLVSWRLVGWDMSGNGITNNHNWTYERMNEWAVFITRL